jgi:signal transduction histidine kinase/sugar phosphate isomerase/epimerase
VNFAAHTIIYGDDVADWSEVLGEIASIGYEGIELFQTYNKIGDPAAFDDLLDKYHLALIGLSGGSFQDRCKLATVLRHKPTYLYLDNPIEMPQDCSSLPGCVAVHPHLYMPVANAHTAEAILAKGFKFLPDVAHLFLSGETTSELLIDVIRRNLKHVIAIHFKDWTPQYGWARATYARGFTELGKGNLPLKEVWAWVRSSFTGWIVVEQDTTERSPSESLAESLYWLEPSRQTVRPHLSPQPSAPCLLGASKADSNEAMAFVSLLHAQECRTPDAVYRLSAEYLARIFSCACVLIYEVHCDIGALTLAAAARVDPPPDELYELTASESIARFAIAEHVIRTISLDHSDDAASPEQTFGRKLGADFLSIVPLNNSFNPHQPELVLMIYTSQPFTKEDSLPMGISRHIRRAVETAWAESRAQVGAEVNYAAGLSKSLQQFLEAISLILFTRLSCESVSVYFPNPSGTGLRHRAIAGKSLLATQDILLEQVRSPVIRCFAERRPVIGLNDLANETPQKDNNAGRLMTPYCAFPLHRLMPLNEVRGVILCEGLRRCGLTRTFSLSDQNIIDAVQSAAAPHIDRLVADELRDESLRRIKHELKGPILMVRGVEELLEDEYEKVQYLIKLCRMLIQDPMIAESNDAQKLKSAIAKLEESFELRDIISIEENMSLMNAVIGKVSFLRLEGPIEISKSRTPLWIDVVEPSLKALKALAKRRGLPVELIEAQPAAKPPALYIDKMRFREVVFNLLDNAIKYAGLGRRSFKIEVIEFSRIGSETRLHVRDWGIGIQPGWEQKIFNEGVRAPDATTLGVAGDGFGLWYSRRIVEAHGGSIAVTAMSKPTEFTILLPAHLQEPFFVTR